MYDRDKHMRLNDVKITPLPISKSSDFNDAERS